MNVPLQIIRQLCALVIAFSLADQASAILWGYYALNGNAHEGTGNNIDLTRVGDASFGSSVHPGLGGALFLDGAGDGAIGAGFNQFTTNDITVVAWAYAESVAGDWNTIIKNWGQNVGGQFHFGLGSAAANTLQNRVAGDGPVTAPNDFPVGQWVHTAFVLDSVALQNRLYINGSLIGTAAYSGTLGFGPATGLGIGHKPNDDGTALDSGNEPGPWNGRIDDVGLFNQVLTATQIQQLYQNGLAGIQLDGTKAPYVSLRVDRADGNVTLRNPTASPLSFNSYEISSADGSLNPGAWLDLAGNPGFPTGNGTGNGWEQDATSNEYQLVESFLTGNSSIGPFAEFPLGKIFHGTEDLTLRFRTASGIVIDSTVEYVGVAPTLFGDYNSDGTVDAADYVMWRKLDLGPADYTTWRTHFAESLGGEASAIAAIPEPDTALLLLLAFAGRLTRRRAFERVA